jgi:hypothetical protein
MLELHSIPASLLAPITETAEKCGYTDLAQFLSLTASTFYIRKLLICGDLGVYTSESPVARELVRTLHSIGEQPTYSVGRNLPEWDDTSYRVFADGSIMVINGHHFFAEIVTSIWSTVHSYLTYAHRENEMDDADTQDCLQDLSDWYYYPAQTT